jgi:hypothetical protein
MRGWPASAVLAAVALVVLRAHAAELQGSYAAVGVRAVRITAAGAVNVRGAGTDVITWKLASSAATGVQRRGDILSLTFPPVPGQLPADVTITVPREVRFCEVRSRTGGVHARDLSGALQMLNDVGPLQMDRIHGSVIARTGGGEIQIGSVDGDARCFTGAGAIRVDQIGGRAQLETASGEIVVQHVHGAAYAMSGGGNVEIAKADSSVTARTSGGVIEIGQAGGPVMADAAGGAIQVSGSSGAQCEASEGGIRLSNVAGIVQALSGSGDILAQFLAGRPVENSKLSTNSGDITVVLPPSYAVTVVAQSLRIGAGGHIVSDYPEIRLTGRSGPWGGLEIAEGSLNGGGPVLQVTASGGSVYLRRPRP